MDPFDEIVIENYLSLTFIINRLIVKKQVLRKEFYSQNMATHMEYRRVSKDKFEMVTKGFRPDSEIEKLFLNIESIDRRIDRHLLRKKYFSVFWTGLASVEQRFLVERFKHHKPIICPQNLIDRILDEISEIETATCFKSGIQPDVLEKETFESSGENLERMCDFFAL